MGNLCSAFDVDQEIMSLRHEHSKACSKQRDCIIDIEHHLVLLSKNIDILMNNYKKMDEKVNELMMKHRISESKIHSNYSFINKKSSQMDDELVKIRKDSFLPTIVDGRGAT